MTEEKKDAPIDEPVNEENEFDALLKEAEAELDAEKKVAVKGKLKEKVKEIQMAEYTLAKLRERIQKNKEKGLNDLYFDEEVKKNFEDYGETEEW